MIKKKLDAVFNRRHISQINITTLSQLFFFSKNNMENMWHKIPIWNVFQMALKRMQFPFELLCTRKWNKQT